MKANDLLITKNKNQLPNSSVPEKPQKKQGSWLQQTSVLMVPPSWFGNMMETNSLAVALF